MIVIVAALRRRGDRGRCFATTMGWPSLRDMQQRTSSLLELRTLSDDSLLTVFCNLDIDGVTLSSPYLDTPVSGGDKPSKKK